MRHARKAKTAARLAMAAPVRKPTTRKNPTRGQAAAVPAPPPLATALTIEPERRSPRAAVKRRRTRDAAPIKTEPSSGSQTTGQTQPSLPSPRISPVLGRPKADASPDVKPSLAALRAADVKPTLAARRAADVKPTLAARRATDEIRVSLDPTLGDLGIADPTSSQPPYPQGCHFEAWRQEWLTAYETLVPDVIHTERRAHGREVVDGIRDRLARVACTCRPEALRFAMKFTPLVTLSGADVGEEVVLQDLQALDDFWMTVYRRQAAPECTGRAYWL